MSKSFLRCSNSAKPKVSSPEYFTENTSHFKDVYVFEKHSENKTSKSFQDKLKTQIPSYRAVKTILKHICNSLQESLRAYAVNNYNSQVCFFSDTRRRGSTFQPALKVRNWKYICLSAFEKYAYIQTFNMFVAFIMIKAKKFFSDWLKQHHQ